MGPPLVPTLALVECLSGDAGRDEPVLRLLRTCELVSEVPVPTARRAAWLRTAAARGTAAEALVVTLAEPGGSVLSGGRRGLEAGGAFQEVVGVAGGGDPPREVHPPPHAVLGWGGVGVALLEGVAPPA